MDSNNNTKTIEASFMTRNDLCQVEGLNVNQDSSHFLARSYMNKQGPVSMNDGSPKSLPPGVSNIQSILHMTPEQLRELCGGNKNAGSFFGELVFWKRHNGILLGKHKWETVGEHNGDKETLSELWDMRWVFPTTEEAQQFQLDMLDATRSEDNDGYLDSLQELSMKPSERKSLDVNLLMHSVDPVLCGNIPKRKKKGMQEQINQHLDPTQYLQQYNVTFVIQNVVVKLYTITGFNNQQSKLKRSSFFGPKGLINITSKAIREWLTHERTEFHTALPKMGDTSRCAKCGNSSNVHNMDLMICSRCKKVAYCGRDCQLAHFKVHKRPCKAAAAATAATTAAATAAATAAVDDAIDDAIDAIDIDGLIDDAINDELN